MSQYQIAKPQTDQDRQEDHRALADMHPGNRFRLMMGMTLLPEPNLSARPPQKMSFCADTHPERTVDGLATSPPSPPDERQIPS